jgi:hypothetical protein
VLITTKSGKEGKAQVSFDTYLGVQNVARKAQMLDTKQYTATYDWAINNHAFKALLGMESYRYEGTYLWVENKTVNIRIFRK